MHLHASSIVPADSSLVVGACIQHSYVLGACATWRSLPCCYAMPVTVSSPGGCYAACKHVKKQPSMAWWTLLGLPVWIGATTGNCSNGVETSTIAF